MTKEDPDKLCKKCEEFDYVMNRKGSVSFDMFVVCNHDDDHDDNHNDSKKVKDE